MKEIIKYYTEKKIKFFLFAPALAIFNYADRCTAISLQAAVEYENGAKVPTSFLTNLADPEVAAQTAPELYSAINEANAETIKRKRREIPKYKYPGNVVTAAMMGYWSKYGIDLKVYRKQSQLIRALDEQKEEGVGIYGNALLLSEKAAAEKAAAEKAAAEKAAAKEWRLSDRELHVVQELSENDKG